LKKRRKERECACGGRDGEKRRNLDRHRAVGERSLIAPAAKGKKGDRKSRVTGLPRYSRRGRGSLPTLRRPGRGRKKKEGRSPSFLYYGLLEEKKEGNGEVSGLSPLAANAPRSRKRVGVDGETRVKGEKRE